MKTVITVCLGGMNFTIEDDAYQRLEAYLDEFRSKSEDNGNRNELMEDVELRIADIFREGLASSHIDAVNLRMVEDMASRIGMPDGSSPHYHSFESTESEKKKAPKKFYRDPDDKKIAGVCSGLAAYLDVDTTLVRVAFLVALLCGSAGLWIYIVFWIIAPIAATSAQKCEMRGLEASLENMRRYPANK